MGNCANKPATTEGAAPAPEEKAVETTEREIVLETKVTSTHLLDDDVPTPPSLAQMLEDEEKKPEVEAAKPTEAAEPAKAETSETKPAEVVAAPAPVEAPASEKKVEEKK
ncbi:hypothetical protein vseg_005113 [Gypsophila vaccaria]